MQKFVVEKSLDVGFAYDGDADRCLCVDEKGNVITGDHILYIYVYCIGGEQSGHIIFSKHASTVDGILTSLKMMEVMLAKKKPMIELAAPLKIYPQVLENVRVTDKKAA